MLELSALIAGPICLICIGIILLLTVRQFQLRRQAPQMVRIPMYPEDPENPLMPQQCTLRDLCNQSTSSGSGSGMFMSLSVCPSVCLSVFKTGSSSHWVTLVSGRFRKPTHATSVHVKGSVQPIYILWLWIRYVYCLCLSVCLSVHLFVFKTGTLSYWGCSCIQEIQKTHSCHNSALWGICATNLHPWVLDQVR